MSRIVCHMMPDPVNAACTIKIVCGEEEARIIHEACKAIEDGNGIEVVKRGAWIKTSKGYECSKCRNISTANLMYCKYCGARMGNFIAEEKKPDNVSKHHMICDELTDTYSKKNADYGDSYHQMYSEEGYAAARLHLSEKLNRFKSLTKTGEQHVKGESVRDTLMDLANYAILTVMEMDQELTE